MIAVAFCIVRPALQYGLLKTIGLKTGLNRLQALRFSEAAFQVLYYSITTCFGLAICSGSSWFRNWDYYDGVPNHVMGGGMRLYLLVQLGYYVHCILFQFVERRKKDFVAMFCHHIATVLALYLSYSANYTRISAAVLAVHDPADVLLNSAKLFRYYGYKRSCDFLFIVFTLVWFGTRLTLFPFLVVASLNHLFSMWLEWDYILIEASVPPLMLCVLQVLHWYWFYLIVRMIVKAFKDKGVESDIRSDDECGDDAEEELVKTKKQQ